MSYTIDELNKKISPFDISEYSKGKYVLALRFSFFKDEYKDFCQKPFRRYAVENGKPITDDYGFYSGYDWDRIMTVCFRNDPNFNEIELDSEGGCFFCDSDNYDVLSEFALKLRELCDNEDEMFKCVCKERAAEELKQERLCTITIAEALDIIDSKNIDIEETVFSEEIVSDDDSLTM